MNQNETIASQENGLIEKDHPHQDMKSLWDRWDKAQKDETPSELVRGYNLLGVLLVITGTLFQLLGSGFLKVRVAPAVIIIGAGILAVKKLRALWLERSLDN